MITGLQHLGGQNKSPNDTVGQQRRLIIAWTAKLAPC